MKPRRIALALILACACSGNSQLAAPTGVTAAANADGSITVGWSAVSGNPSYLVLRGTSAGGESTTPVATVSTASYADAAVNLAAGTTYYYQVVAHASG